MTGVVSGQDTETVERFPTERDVTALMEATKALTAKQARCALEAASAYVWARAVPASVLAAARTELDEAKAERDDSRPGPRVVKIVKFSKSGNARPQVSKVKVLGNERVTQGGEVKRAKRRKPTSVKKSFAD